MTNVPIFKSQNFSRIFTNDKVTATAIITTLLLIIALSALIFTTTLNHEGLSDKEKLRVSIIHSISAFCVLFTLILLCVYIRVRTRSKDNCQDDDEERRITKESEEDGDNEINLYDDVFGSYEEIIVGKSSPHNFDKEKYKCLIYPESAYHV